MNADSEEMGQGDEGIVSSAVIDCPEDENEEYGLPSVGDKKELSSVDINKELSPEDRQNVTSPLNQFDDGLSVDPGYTHLIKHDIKKTQTNLSE